MKEQHSSAATSKKNPKKHNERKKISLEGPSHSNFESPASINPFIPPPTPPALDEHKPKFIQLFARKRMASISEEQVEAEAQPQAEAQLDGASGLYIDDPSVRIYC